MNIVQVVPKLPMFDDFSQEEIHELFGSDGMLVNYHDGDFIIRQGEKGTALFVLIEGEVGITKSQAKDIELNTLKPGAFFGESPLVANSTRLTNVIAKGEASVLKLDAERFRSLNPAIVNKFHIQLNKILVQRLNAMNNNLVEVQTGIDNFIKIYESHRQKMEEDPLISDEFKMIQKLWSAYLANLRTR